MKQFHVNYVDDDIKDTGDFREGLQSLSQDQLDYDLYKNTRTQSYNILYWDVVTHLRSELNEHCWHKLHSYKDGKPLW